MTDLATDLTAVSLFSGIGGIDLALERAGIPVKAAVELDKDCRGVLRRHFPKTALFGDIREVTGAQLRAAGFVPWRGVLAGGWPCQDLSIAGRRAGLGGARSGLFWEVVRLADELSPRWLVFENVPGLLSAVCSCPGDETCLVNGRTVRCGRWEKRAGKRVFIDRVTHTPDGGACPGGCMELHGGAMGAVLGALGHLGYGFAYRVLDAQFFGVPQRRERVFIVGCLGDWAAPAEILLEPESSAGHPAAGRPAGTDIAGTLGSRAGGSRSTDLDGHGAYVADVAGALGTVGPGGGWRIGADEAAVGQPVASTLQGGGRRGHRVDAEGAAGGHLIPLDLAQLTHPENRSNPKPGDPMGTLGPSTQPAVAFPIQDGRDMDKSMNGLGVSEDGQPSYTLDTTGVQSVAYTLRSDPGAGNAHNTSYAIAAPLTAGSAAGEGVRPPGRRKEDDVNLAIESTAEPMAFNPWTGDSKDHLGYSDKPGAISCTQVTGVTIPVDLRNAARDSEAGETAGTGLGKDGDPSYTVTAASRAPVGVATAAAVRRLTPLERERLQGFPDNWTKWRIAPDGTEVEQSDAARDRQTGNAVAEPCVEWITRRLAAVDAAAQAAAGDREAS